jgi:hypothetical protein
MLLCCLYRVQTGTQRSYATETDRLKIEKNQGYTLYKWAMFLVSNIKGFKQIYHLNLKEHNIRTQYQHLYTTDTVE